ncbi:hypothetical protein LCGC14_1786710 [marine sediment metagenome]|uniref:Uncharacterized protein n=1 Tax=marine sediment metagenome TaxID=412755 RepID=A0A0F9J8Q0_9ZZZZ
MVLIGSELKDHLIGSSSTFVDGNTITVSITGARATVTLAEGANRKSMSIELTVAPGSDLETELKAAVEAAIQA